MVDDFAIVSPVNNDLNFPNYKLFIKKEKNIQNNIISVDTLDGFSMLINIEKFPNKLFFDEDFFLYLENDDLCLRAKKLGEKIYIVKDSIIEHLGGISNNEKMELLRNWHWMWSKFHFNKKHHGYLNALSKIFLNLLGAILNYFYFLLIFNSYKRKIYAMRISGIFNSIIGKKSWFRI
jgi:GT2 family glycosyltransferase